MIYSIPIKCFRSHVLLFQKSEFLGEKMLKIWKNGTTTALCKESCLRLFLGFVGIFSFLLIVWASFCYLQLANPIVSRRFWLSRTYISGDVLWRDIDVKSISSSQTMKKHKFWNFENLFQDGFYSELFYTFCIFWFNISIFCVSTDHDFLLVANLWVWKAFSMARSYIFGNIKA